VLGLGLGWQSREKGHASGSAGWEELHTGGNGMIFLAGWHTRVHTGWEKNQCRVKKIRAGACGMEAGQDE
jgi:hypothetical protein